MRPCDSLLVEKRQVRDERQTAASGDVVELMRRRLLRLSHAADASTREYSLSTAVRTSSTRPAHGHDHASYLRTIPSLSPRALYHKRPSERLLRTGDSKSDMYL